MRTVIFHYHLFKNAGTSLDAALKENFEDGEWVTKEFPNQAVINRQQVKEWIIDNPEAKCFSSHTAKLPPPNIENIKVLPIIFVRDPIDRIASAYMFEKKQGGGSIGSVLARNTTFSGYIETSLAIPNYNQCRNFHIDRISLMLGEKEGSKLERSMLAMEKLPFVGVVEQFTRSLGLLEEWLASEGFIGIRLKPVEHNVTRERDVNIEEKLDEIKFQLGSDIYDMLLIANLDDYKVYEKAQEALDSGC
jgi:hypothetical protein